MFVVKEFHQLSPEELKLYKRSFVEFCRKNKKEDISADNLEGEVDEELRLKTELAQSEFQQYRFKQLKVLKETGRLEGWHENYIKQFDPFFCCKGYDQLNDEEKALYKRNFIDFCKKDPAFLNSLKSRESQNVELIIESYLSYLEVQSGDEALQAMNEMQQKFEEYRQGVASKILEAIQGHYETFSEEGGGEWFTGLQSVTLEERVKEISRICNLDIGIAEEIKRTEDEAAIKIQRWFRGHKIKGKERSAVKPATYEGLHKDFTGQIAEGKKDEWPKRYSKSLYEREISSDDSKVEEVLSKTRYNDKAEAAGGKKVDKLERHFNSGQSNWIPTIVGNAKGNKEFDGEVLLSESEQHQHIEVDFSGFSRAHYDSLALLQEDVRRAKSYFEENKIFAGDKRDDVYCSYVRVQGQEVSDVNNNRSERNTVKAISASSNPIYCAVTATRRGIVTTFLPRESEKIYEQMAQTIYEKRGDAMLERAYQELGMGEDYLWDIGLLDKIREDYKKETEGYKECKGEYVKQKMRESKGAVGTGRVQADLEAEYDRISSYEKLSNDYNALRDAYVKKKKEDTHSEEELDSEAEGGGEDASSPAEKDLEREYDEFHAKTYKSRPTSVRVAAQYGVREEGYRRLLESKETFPQKHLNAQKIVRGWIRNEVNEAQKRELRLAQEIARVETLGKDDLKLVRDMIKGYDVGPNSGLRTYKRGSYQSLEKALHLLEEEGGLIGHTEGLSFKQTSRTDYAEMKFVGSDITSGYVWIPGTNFYVRAQLAAQDDKVHYLKNGQAAYKEFKKGEVVIDMNTVYHSSDGKSFEAYGLKGKEFEKLKERFGYRASEVKNRYDNFTLVASSSLDGGRFRSMTVKASDGLVESITLPQVLALDKDQKVIEFTRSYKEKEEDELEQEDELEMEEEGREEDDAAEEGSVEEDEEEAELEEEGSELGEEEEVKPKVKPKGRLAWRPSEIYVAIPIEVEAKGENEVNLNNIRIKVSVAQFDGVVVLNDGTAKTVKAGETYRDPFPYIYNEDGGYLMVRPEDYVEKFGAEFAANNRISSMRIAPKMNDEAYEIEQKFIRLLKSDAAKPDAIYKMLREIGDKIDINARDSNGNSLLHLAAARRDAGVKVGDGYGGEEEDAESDDKKTIVELLIDRGADATLRNKVLDKDLMTINKRLRSGWANIVRDYFGVVELLTRRKFNEAKAKATPNFKAMGQTAAVVAKDPDVKRIIEMAEKAKRVEKVDQQKRTLKAITDSFEESKKERGKNVEMMKLFKKLINDLREKRYLSERNDLLQEAAESGFDLENAKYKGKILEDHFSTVDANDKAIIKQIQQFVKEETYKALQDKRDDIKAKSDPEFKELAKQVTRAMSSANSTATKQGKILKDSGADKDNLEKREARKIDSKLEEELRRVSRSVTRAVKGLKENKQPENPGHLEQPITAANLPDVVKGLYGDQVNRLKNRGRDESHGGGMEAA